MPGRLPTILEPPVKAKPEVDIDVFTALHPEYLNDAYMYVHCHFDNLWEGMLIRIWSSTFLLDSSSPARSKLVHAENISIAPQWTMIPDKRMFSFLLIFGALPRSCTVFDLREEIPEPGGFHVKSITRNDSDVYHVDLD